MTAAQAEAIVARMSPAQVRNLASFRAGHQMSKSALNALAAKGVLAQLEDGRWCAVLPVLDAFDRRYPPP